MILNFSVQLELALGHVGKARSTVRSRKQGRRGEYPRGRVYTPADAASTPCAIQPLLWLPAFYSREEFGLKLKDLEPTPNQSPAQERQVFGSLRSRTLTASWDCVYFFIKTPLTPQYPEIKAAVANQPGHFCLSM